jgi:dTDP-4-dehydrorhamnose reductase
MLGQDLTALLRDAGQDVEGVDRDSVDITDPRSTAGLADGYDVVVNCAAFTAVDAAEAEEAQAFAVNAVGAANVARSARRAGARLVHISTDYVFDGVAQSPYAEDASIAPRSAYGRTKAAGEWAVRAEAPDHLIVRTAWLYGANGACFPKTIVRAGRERGRLEVVADQVGQPTWTVDLARLCVTLASDAAPGTYHGTSSGQTSWFGFACAAIEAAGLDPGIVHPTTSEGYVRAAQRPAYSVLAHDALHAAGVEPIGDWAARWAVAAGTVLA